MKKLILAFLFTFPAFAGEAFRPSMEKMAVLESVSSTGVTIDGHFYRVPGGTVIERGKGENRVKYQLKAGERVLFKMKFDKKGKPTGEIQSIRPMNSIMLEAQ